MNTVDKRVVELQFNNAQFESGVQQSVGTLQKLKNALNFGHAEKSLTSLQNAGKHFSMGNVVDNIQTVADRFSFLGNLVDQVRTRINNSIISMGKGLVTAIPNQIISGGKRRAQNIEQAQFQLKGLLKDDFDWEKISEDLDYAVSGTAYGLDAAAKAAAQLKASNIDFGDEMKTALRGISGVAAMTNSEYEDIAHIFTTIAGQGKMMTEQLNQFAGRGLNVAATLADHFKVSEAELRDMVTKGKVDFKTFASAMNEAFGEQATKANDTFTGALSNVKASLSRMGAQFATPAYENLRKVLVALIPVMKDVEKFIKPISAAFTDMAGKISTLAVNALSDLHVKFLQLLGLTTELNFKAPLEQLRKDIWQTASKIPYVTGRMFSGQAKTVDQAKKALEAYKKTRGDIDEQAAAYIKNGQDEAWVNKFKESAYKDAEAELTRYVDATTLANLLDSEALALQKESNEERKKSLEDTRKLSDEIFKMLGIETKGTSDVLVKDFEDATSGLTKILDHLQKRTKKGAIAAYAVDETTDKTRLLTEATTAAEQAYKKVDETAEKWIKAGKDEATVNEYKASSYKKIADALSGLNKTTTMQVELETRQTAGEKATQEIRKKAVELATTLRQKAAELLGIELDENAQLKANATEYQGIEDLAKDVILGKYGNGEARVKALEELGVSYGVIQNKVNELLGSSKRYAVTAEEEARTLAFFGVKAGEAGGELKKTETTFDKVTNALAGIGAALSIVQHFGDALLTHIIRPFLSWSIPKVLDLILTGLSEVGKVLQDVNKYIIDTDFFNVKFEALANWFINLKDAVVKFWNEAKELEGVKQLAATFGTLRDALIWLWDLTSQKLVAAFNSFRQALGFTDKDSQDLLDIVNEVAGALSNLINFLADGVYFLGEFFSPLLDWLATLGPAIKDFWEKIDGFKGLRSGVQPLIDWFTNIGIAFKIFWSNITNNLGLQGFLDKFNKEGTAGFKTAVTNLFTNIKTSFDVLIKGVKGKFKNFLITVFGEEKGNEYITKISNAITKVKDAFTDLIEKSKPLETLNSIIQELFGSDIGEKVANFGTAILGFLDSFAEGGKPEEAIQKVWDALAEMFDGLFKGDLLTKLKNIGDTIRDFLSNLFSFSDKNTGKKGQAFLDFLPEEADITAGVQRVGTSIKNSIKSVFFGDEVFASEGPAVGESLVDGVAKGVESAVAEKKINPFEFILNAASSLVQTLYDKAREIGSGFVNIVQKGIAAFNPSNITKILSAGGIIFFLSKIIGFIKIIKGFHIKSIFSDIGAALRAFTQEQKTESILNLAKAVGIITVALIALTFVDSKKLFAVIGAISALVLVVGLAKMLSNAFSKMHDVGSTTLSFFTGLSQAFKTAATLTGIGLMFAGISAAFYLLAKGIETLSEVNWDSADRAIAVMSGIFIALAILIPIIAKIAKEAEITSALGIAFIGLAAAIFIIIKSLEPLKTLVADQDTYSRMLWTLLAIFAGIGLLMRAGEGGGAKDFHKIGLGLVLLSAGLFAFGLALRTFKDIDIVALAKGLIVFAAAATALVFILKDLDGEKATGILKIAVAFLILTPALIILGKNAETAGLGLLVLAGALAVFLLAAYFAEKVSEGLETLSKTLLLISTAALVLGIALPVLGKGLIEFGSIISSSWEDFWNGFLGMIPLLGAFTLVAVIAGGAALKLGVGLLAVAAAATLLYLLFTGKLDDIIGIFTDGVGGIAESVGGAVETIGGALGVFKEFGSTLSSIFGEGGKKTYTMSIDNYKATLKNMNFVTDEVASELATKVENLGSLDGSDYSLAITDVIGYIRNLNLDEEKTNELITETLTAAEQQQKEQFTYTVHQIKMILSENGVSIEVQQEIFEHLEQMAQLKQGSITYIVTGVHTEIQSLDISDEDKKDLIEAFDNVVSSQLQYNAAVNNITAYLDENTNLDVEGIAQIQTAIDEVTDRTDFYATLETIYATIDNVDAKDKEKIRGKIRDALKQKVRMTTNVGTIGVMIEDAVLDESRKEEIAGKVTAALKKIDDILAEGGEGSAEAAAAELKDIKVIINGIDKAVLPPEAKTEIIKQVDQAFNSIKAFRGEVSKLYVTVDELLPKQQADAFKTLWDALINADSYNEAEVEKLWIKCNELGMSNEEISDLLKKVGVVLDEGIQRGVELHNLRLIMDQKGIEEDARQQIEDAITELQSIDQDANAEEFEIHRKAVVDLMIANGMSEDEANKLVESYVGEAGDAKTAKLSLITMMIENATFATDAEKAAYKERVNEMMNLYGQDLTDAIESFRNDIIEKSTLDEGQKSLISESILEVANIAKTSYEELYAEILEYQQQLRRADFLGSYIVTKKGEMVNAGSAVAKEMDKFFKNIDHAITDNDLTNFAQVLIDKGYSPEEIIASFSGTGLTDEELFKALFPLGAQKDLVPATFREFIRPYVQSLVDGTSEEIKNELSSYGKIDWGEYLTPELDENGNETGYVFSTDKRYKGTERDMAQEIDDDLQLFIADIKARRHELDKTLSDSDPVTFEQIWEYFYGEEGQMQYHQYTDSPLVNFLQGLHQAAEESGNAEEYIQTAAQSLNRTLYETGDGITKATDETSEQFSKAYATLFKTLDQDQQNAIAEIQKIFDPTGKYENVADFYGWFKSVLGSGFGAEGLEGFDLTAFFEGGGLDISGAFTEYLTNAIAKEQISPDVLANLYKQFPDLRNMVRDYIASKEGTEEEITLPEGYQEALNEAIDKYKEEFDAAMQKALSDDETTAQEGNNLLSNLFKSGNVSQAEAASWTEELTKNFPNLGEKIKGKIGEDITNVDFGDIGSQLFSKLSLEDVDLNDRGINIFEGLDQGLLSKIPDLANTTASASDAINDTLDSKMSMASPSKVMKTKGLNIMLGLKLGMEHNKSKPAEVMRECAEACINAISDKISAFGTQGSLSGLAYTAGISSKQFLAKLAGAGLAAQAYDGSKSYDSLIEQAGRDFGEGYVRGIRDKIDDAKEAGAALANAAAAANKEASDEHSPSKVAMRLGNFFGEGYVIGLQQFSKQAARAGGDLAESAIDSFGNPLQIIEDLLNSDLDMDPTIRPVMDLSQIQNGVRTINSLMPDTEMGLNFISSSMNRVRTTNEDVVAAISDLSKQMENSSPGNTYNVNGITYDDGSNISSAIRSLIHEARIERRR